MIHGTARVSSSVINPSPIKPAVMIRLVYASPRSASRRTARTICGTRTVFNTPPASKMYMLFGTVVEMVNISACRVPLPNKYTNSMSRKNPMTRERAVPAAMSMLAETSRLVCRRSSVVGPGPPLIPGGTAPPEPPALIPGGTDPPSPAESFPIPISDIKFLCRCGAQRGQLILRGLAPCHRTGSRFAASSLAPFLGHLADSQEAGGDKNDAGSNCDCPTRGAVLGDLHLDVERTSDRLTGLRHQLRGNRHDAVGLGSYLSVGRYGVSGSDLDRLDRFDRKPLGVLRVEHKFHLDRPGIGI